jgi:glucosylceramidase
MRFPKFEIQGGYPVNQQDTGLKTVNPSRSKATAVACAATLFLMMTSGATLAATGPTVSSWVTTPDRSSLLAPAARTTFDSNTATSGTTISINPAQVFQTMDGFGASITDSSASLIYNLSAAQRTELMDAVFSPARGIGMSVLRQPIGASDFVVGAHYTYNDLPAGQTDFAMSRFSIAHDQAKILPLLQEALRLNPSIKVMASPWSAPAWMKTNGNLIGGQLKNEPAIYKAYALYLLKFVQAYGAAGVPIDALTLQNEPQNRTPKQYPGMGMSVAQEAAVINELGPMLSAAGLGAVKIISYDHNWTEDPGDIEDAKRLGLDPETNYASDILRSSAAKWIAGTGYHCYSGDTSAGSIQTALHNSFPDKGIWLTECSGFRGFNDAFPKYFADTLKWHAKNVGMGTIQNWSK